MKAIIKVGLDLGASRVKASFLKDKEIIDIFFPNRVDTGTSAQGIKVNIEGVVVTVGTVGGFSNSINKKINYKYLNYILLAVTQRIKEELGLLEDVINLEINTILPPQEFTESRVAYKEAIKSISGTKAKINDDEKEITLEIKDVKVGAEGVALLKVCDLNKVEKDLTQLLLLDVGSSTTDIVILSKFDNKWNIKDATTSDIAGRKICEAIATGINGSVSGLSLKWEDIEMNQSYELDGHSHDISTHMEYADKVVSQLMADLDRIGNIRQFKVILAGGGSRLLKESKLFQDYCKTSCIDDSLLDYGNSRGALKA